jgi:hypothetical protein
MGLNILNDIRILKNEQNDDGEWIIHSLIDENGDFDFSGLEVYGKPYLDTPQLVKDTIHDIVDFYQNKVNKFILTTDYGEAFSSMYPHVLLRKAALLPIIDYFEQNEMLDRLVWRGNGLNPQFNSNIKFEPISFWLGRNIEHSMEIGPRKFDYNFLSLYRGFKQIREDFHNFLQESGVLNKTLYSYNSEFMFDDQSHWTNDYAVSLDNESVTAPMLMKPGPYYLNTFCSIVYEALWDLKVVFPTEKLNKCLMVGHPFVIVSTPRYLANIKKIGFKTFDQWWDESYDDEVDDSKRFKKLQNTILQISEWNLEECERVYAEMLPTLIHNQNLVKELSDFKVSNTYNLLNIDIDEYNPPVI